MIGWRSSIAGIELEQFITQVCLKRVPSNQVTHSSWIQSLAPVASQVVLGSYCRVLATINQAFGTIPIRPSPCPYLCYPPPVTCPPTRRSLQHHDKQSCFQVILGHATPSWPGHTTIGMPSDLESGREFLIRSDCVALQGS